MSTYAEAVAFVTAHPLPAPDAADELRRHSRAMVVQLEPRDCARLAEAVERLESMACAWAWDFARNSGPETE